MLDSFSNMLLNSPLVALNGPSQQPLLPETNYLDNNESAGLAFQAEVLSLHPFS